MTPQSLMRKHHRPQAQQPLLDGLTLARARVHEFCGNARRTLAMMLARQMQGPVFWIEPGWARDRLNPDGMVDFANPGRVTFLAPRRPEDLLWSMEEILRTGAVALVVADLPAPPALTPVRRLHLAAENGARDGALAPLGLLLCPGDGGAQGIESRWHMAQAHQGDAPGWTLTRTRARAEPVKAWRVGPAGSGEHLAPIVAV
jgi:protein ImuA